MLPRHICSEATEKKLNPVKCIVWSRGSKKPIAFFFCCVNATPGINELRRISAKKKRNGAGFPSVSSVNCIKSKLKDIPSMVWDIWLMSRRNTSYIMCLLSNGSLHLPKHCKHVKKVEKPPFEASEMR